MKYFFVILFSLIFTNSQSQENISFYFNSNKSELEKQELENLNLWIQNNKQSKILSITGSTDEIGSTGYNDTLSQKRVDYIFNKVKTTVKIREDFKSISLGEKAAKSNTKAENRKAVIVFLQEKDLAKEEKLIVKNEEIITTIDSPNTLNNMFLNGKVGDFVKLKNIEFYLGSDVLVDNSFKELNELLRVLNEFESVKIEIQGHVCCNSNAKDKESIRLSFKRAKKINDFLVERGVNKIRLRYVGFGSSLPIHKIPEETLEQQEANRRVEILILDK